MNPDPDRLPLSLQNEKTHEEKRREQRLKSKDASKAPAKDPCQAWRSSWAAGLKTELAIAMRGEDARDVLW
jgi:hypothetical protein